MTDIIAKIAAASLEVGGKLAPEGKNKEQNYSYVSADQILAICGQALAKQGVIVLPAIVDQEMESVTYTNNYGKTVTRLDARVDFIFHIAGEGQPMEVAWTGRGSDYATPDKALYKAITSGHKYFLMKLLNVGAGNPDGEHEEGDGEQKITPRSERKPQAPKPAAPSGVDRILNQAKSIGDKVDDMLYQLPMTLEEAENTLNSEGTRYGDIPVDKLASMANSMAKIQGTDKEKPEHAVKIAAIQTILAHRAKGG